MIDDDRVQALQTFGYTERKAAFLALAALHSGYFLGRQVAHFLDRARGRANATLARKS